MKGYLIYHDKEAKKNHAFIELFQEQGKKLGISFTYISSEQYQNKPLPDFVLNRTRESAISTWYEERGVFVFHSSAITEIGNHKYKTLEFLENHLSKYVKDQKWSPDSLLLPVEKLTEWIENLNVGKWLSSDEEMSAFLDRYKCVLKSVDGHGGTEVAKLPDMRGYRKVENWNLKGCGSTEERQIKCKELIQVLQRFVGKKCILQEKICSDSEDVRVYILGNKIYKAIRRKGKNDFRSNFSLGGSASVYELSSQQKLWIQNFIDAFGQEVLGLVGLDFIIDKNGQLIFNELEEMVGCRMLYQYTDCNVVEDYVKWIQKFMENNSCH